MNKKEFRKFILETATKHFKDKNNSEEKAVIKEEKKEDIIISAEQVKILAEDMKKINKKMDLRNPLINPDFFDKVKKEEKPLVNESQKTRWQNLYNYDVPNDEKR